MPHCSLMSMGTPFFILKFKFSYDKYSLDNNWRPFYEARFGVEIFVELYDSTLSSPVSSYVLERCITSYFIAFTVVVYWYYGYLPIS